jgi:hypothetical protein
MGGPGGRGDTWGRDRGSGRRAFRSGVRRRGGRWVAAAPPAAAAAGGAGIGADDGIRVGRRASSWRNFFPRFYRFAEARQKEDAELAHASLLFLRFSNNISSPFFIPRWFKNSAGFNKGRIEHWLIRSTVSQQLSSKISFPCEMYLKIIYLDVLAKKKL